MSAIDGVSEIFDPERLGRRPRLRGPDRPDLPPREGARHGPDRLRPARRAQRVPAAHRRRAAPGPRARAHLQRRRLRAAHRQRPERRRTASGRSAPAATSGSAAARATSTPRARPPRPVDKAKLGRLHILECQRLIRFMPKIVICVVPGWAAGGGHCLHVVCDLTLASAEHGAVQADRRRRRLVRRRLRVGVPRPPGRPEVRPRDLLPRPGVLRRGRRPDGHGQPGGPARRARGDRAGVGPADQRQVARPRSGC